MAVGTGVVILDKDGGRVVELDANGNFPVFIAASGDIYNVDASKASVSIHHEHHKVHRGEYYMCSRFSGDVDTANPIYLHLLTPDTALRAHFIGAADAGAAGRVQLFENPTIGANGVALTVVNANRNSANTSAIQAFHSPVVSSDGTILMDRYVGGGTNPASFVGGSLRSDAEIVLKQNEDYLIKFTPDADNAKAVVFCEFYESNIG